MSRAIDADCLLDALNGIILDYISEGKYPDRFGIDDAINLVENAPTLTSPNEPRMIDADKLAKRIAGHSNYHGDSIPAAIYCAAEGQENDAPIRPIETTPNEWISVEERLPEPGDLIVYADNTVWGYQYGICRVCGKEKAFDYWMPLQDLPNNRPPEGEEDTK